MMGAWSSCEHRPSNASGRSATGTLGRPKVEDRLGGAAVCILARDMRLTPVPRRLAGNASEGQQPQDGPAAHMAASLRPHGSHHIRVAAWHLELLFGGSGARGDPAATGREKLGAVRTDQTETSWGCY
jgi:hypothetical protein